MNNPVSSCTGWQIIAVIAVLFSACTLLEEIVEDGAKLKNKELYEEALRKYIQAYDKDPEIVDLEALITDSGNQVVADLIARSAETEAGAAANFEEEMAARSPTIRSSDHPT